MALEDKKIDDAEKAAREKQNVLSCPKVDSELQIITQQDEVKDICRQIELQNQKGRQVDKSSHGSNKS